MYTYSIYRDGKLLIEFKDQTSDFEAFKWLLRNQSHSTDWALKYEGYKIEILDQSTGEKTDYKTGKVI